jgi:hypothetical protein
MEGKKFEIAKSVVKAVIDTLTNMDYVNVKKIKLNYL